MLHKRIRKEFQKGNSTLAFKTFEYLSQLALESKESAVDMTGKVKVLVQHSEDALIAAKNDPNVTEEQKKQIQKFIDEAKARSVALEESVKELGRMIDEAREEEANHAKTAETARDREFGLQLACAITGALPSIASAAAPMRAGEPAVTARQSAVTAYEKEVQAAAHRRKLLSQRAEDKAAWAKDVEALKTMKMDKNEIE